MATLKTISAALKLVDAKKENLRKAFEDLQAHSSSLSSFTLTWPDLDSYFTSLQSSLDRKFKILQSQLEQSQSQPSKPPSSNQPQSQPSKTPPKQPQSLSQTQSKPSSSSVVVKDASGSGPIPARPELKSFCEKMDGLGLRKYMVERPKERNTIRDELPDAFRCAPDPAAMVLDAMEGFFVPNSKGDKDIELCAIRRSCIVLLEKLMGLKVEIGAEVKEKAKKLAAEWKGKVSVDGENPLEALGFFHLLATFDLADGFNVDDLIDFAVIVAKFREAVELCRVLGFGDRISDIILKLIGKGKQLLAVKFIFEFELLAKFPPVPLLKEYVMGSKKFAQKSRKDGKNFVESRNEAITKEVSALKAVIKIIEDRKLEPEYSKETLMKRIETLENEKSDRKRSAAAPASKTQQQSKPKKLSGSKRPRTTAPAGPAAIPMSVAATSSTVPTFQQSHLQPEGLMLEHPTPYLSSSTGPYGLAGSTPAVAPYTGSSTVLYGSAGTPFGIPGNFMPTQPHAYPSESHVPYPSESHVPSGYIDRPVAYGGYVLPPQYHPPYHPQ